MAYLLNETLFTKPVTKKAKSVNYIKISEFINLLDSNKDQMAFTIDQENQMMLKHKLKLLDRVNKLMLRPDKNARDQFTAVCNQLNKLTPVTCQKAVISWIKNNQDKPIPSLAGVKRAASSRKRGPTISEIINEDMNEYLYHTIKKSPGLFSIFFYLFLEFLQFFLPFLGFLQFFLFQKYKFLKSIRENST